MKNIEKPNQPEEPKATEHLNSVLEEFFINSLREMYYAENAIGEEFQTIKDQIISSNLEKILNNHFSIHLKHKNRLEKIFKLKNENIESIKCYPFDALVSESKNHLSVFTGDPANWEIALILVTQKMTHYKIASYGGLAHLAIKLNSYKAATLLAICVQEEEEFIANNLNGIIDTFLSAHVDGYKN